MRYIMKINALFVETNGVYFNLPSVEAWDIKRNAFNCKNGAPAIAHPPCKRWGRYWQGGPSVEVPRILGDDDCCFAYSLWYVRSFGGIIEHPEASYAWPYYGLKKPPKSGNWIEVDNYGGMGCCVEQGHYGHKARKATWLYVNKVKPIELTWGKAEGKMKVEDSPRSKEAALKMRAKKDRNPIKRLSAYERLATPIEFRDLLLKMIKGSKNDDPGDSQPTCKYEEINEFKEHLQEHYMNEEKIKPCPFCGSSNIEIESSFGAWMMFCKNKKCGNIGFVETKILYYKDALEKWNTRKDVP